MSYQKIITFGLSFLLLAPASVALAQTSHLACNSSNQCLTVSGSGPDTCISDQDCELSAQFGGTPGSSSAANPTFPPAGQCATPTGVVALATADGNITVSWSNQDGRVSGYTLSWGSQSSKYDHTQHANTTSVTVSGLAKNTTYFFTVAAMGENCLNSAYSAEVSARVGNAGSVSSSGSAPASSSAGSSVKKNTTLPKKTSSAGPDMSLIIVLASPALLFLAFKSFQKIHI